VVKRQAPCAGRGFAGRWQVWLPWHESWSVFRLPRPGGAGGNGCSKLLKS